MYAAPCAGIKKRSIDRMLGITVKYLCRSCKPCKITCSQFFVQRFRFCFIVQAFGYLSAIRPSLQPSLLNVPRTHTSRPECSISALHSAPLSSAVPLGLHGKGGVFSPNPACGNFPPLHLELSRPHLHRFLHRFFRAENLPDHFFFPRPPSVGCGLFPCKYI